MAKNWEDGEDCGAEILGIGSFQFIHGGSGKGRSKTQIGFVRNVPSSNARREPSTKNVHRKSSVLNKGRGQKGKARSK